MMNLVLIIDILLPSLFGINVVAVTNKNNLTILQHFLTLIESSSSTSNYNVADSFELSSSTSSFSKSILFNQYLNDVNYNNINQSSNSIIDVASSSYDYVYGGSNNSTAIITTTTKSDYIHQQHQQPNEFENLQQPSTQLRQYSSYEELELLNKTWQILIILLYTLTAIFAFVGNILSICVLTTGKRSSKELRIFLVNLSMSDIMMALFSIPFTYLDFMLGRWIFAPAFCPIVQQMQITCVFVSVYTLTAIGIDRYMAIIHPLFSQRYSRSFGPITITIIWLLGFILGVFQWANTEAEPFLIANETNYDCKEISSDHSQYFTIIIFLITFALPMTILTFTYFSIGIKIFRHSTPGNADAARDRVQQSSKIKIMKMLVTIVILFIVCWLPLQILNLFIYFARELMVDVYNSRIGFPIYVVIAFMAHWFSMANSFVNPIIYCFMSENFRADLSDLFLQRLNLFRIMRPSTIINNHRSHRFSHQQRKRNSTNTHHNQSYTNSSPSSKQTMTNLKSYSSTFSCTTNYLNNKDEECAEIQEETTKFMNDEDDLQQDCDGDFNIINNSDTVDGKNERPESLRQLIINNNTSFNTSETNSKNNQNHNNNCELLYTQQKQSLPTKQQDDHNNKIINKQQINETTINGATKILQTSVVWFDLNKTKCSNKNANNSFNNYDKHIQQHHHHHKNQRSSYCKNSKMNDSTKTKKKYQNQL